MSDLNNLVSKIINDSEAEAKKIIGAAEQKAAEIVSESVSAAEKEKERITESAKLDAEKAAEQVVTGKKLEIRDEHLGAKHGVVDSVFKTVAEKLNNLPKEEFMAFLQKSLLSMDLDGEELVVPAKYGITDIKDINDFLAGKGKKGTLSLHKGGRDIAGGFILLKEGIENNNTFKVLVDYYRYGLESEITAKLF